MPFCRIGKKNIVTLLHIRISSLFSNFLGKGMVARAPLSRGIDFQKKKRGEEDLVARAQPHKERSQTKDQKFNFDDIF